MAHTARTLPPPVIAAAAWLVPGLGYFLLGHRARALTVGVTIVLLFVFGLLIGGVGIIEVPGYKDGQRITSRTGEWALQANLIGELRDKPWSIAQVLAGPMALAGMGWSVWATNPDNGFNRIPPGPPSHVRVNEIGVLYTAVAGMLNLLVILDASGRAAAAREN